MWTLWASLTVHPFDLVRVDDPTYGDAIARSATGVVSLEPPPPGTPWQWEAVPEPDGWVGAEAIDVMNVLPWRAEGATGEGVRVAVFDLQWEGVELGVEGLGDAETHDCFAHPSCRVPMDTLRTNFSFEAGRHGVACAEIVRAIAPEAELHLVRVNGRTTLENAVDWAIREGIDVVSMSLSFFNTSYYDGTGPISRQARRLYEAGILLVTSSGNYARSHWEGRFVDADGDRRMDFDGEGGLWVAFGEGSGNGLYLTWDQYGRCGATDLDLWLYDRSGALVGRSTDAQVRGADRCEPMERLRATIAEAGWYWLEVTAERGSLAGLDVDILSTTGRLARPRPSGSVADPAASGAAFAVGAVRAEGYFDNEVESFSSWGRTAEGRVKPDIVGPDGLATVSYGPGGFFGTSASTPAVAGAVAVVLSGDPELSPLEAARRLQGWALSRRGGTLSPDLEQGAGKARLPVSERGGRGCRTGASLASLWILPFGWLRRRRASS